DEFQHQYPAGGKLPEDLRYPHACPFEQFLHCARIARFDGVIEFLTQVLGETLGQVSGPDPASRAPCGIEPPGNCQHNVKVSLDHLLDPWALTLYDHLRAAPQPRPVHLADRGSGERHGIEPLENLVEGTVQLGPQQPLNSGLIGGLDTILQYRQMICGALSQPVRAGCERTTETP